ncbi:hypothetical protein ACIRU3_19775 [Streptomyces sp. NPDC101151]|uniref:hypothetical protein n=1 Tax=Streptomyces sp. NPDC101151 TaxID=3366115 RepID=UPI0037F1EB64
MDFASAEAVVERLRLPTLEKARELLVRRRGDAPSLGGRHPGRAARGRHPARQRDRCR